MPTKATVPDRRSADAPSGVTSSRHSRYVPGGSTNQARHGSGETVMPSSSGIDSTKHRVHRLCQSVVITVRFRGEAWHLVPMFLYFTFLWLLD